MSLAGGASAFLVVVAFFAVGFLSRVRSFVTTVEARFDSFLTGILGVKVGASSILFTAFSLEDVLSGGIDAESAVGIGSGCVAKSGAGTGSDAVRCVELSVSSAFLFLGTEFFVPARYPCRKAKRFKLLRL